MRKCSEVDSFPYTAKYCCLIEVRKNNIVEQITHYRKMDLDDVKNAYLRAANNESVLYYVWPGNYRSDMFVVDDLDQFSKAFEIKF